MAPTRKPEPRQAALSAFFEENSVTVTVKENRTTPELASALDQGHPVLLCIQAWAAAEDGYNTQNSDDADTYLAEGHWVICIGYQKQELGYVFYFNDPACVGYCMMSEQDLNNRWIDMDTEEMFTTTTALKSLRTERVITPMGCFIWNRKYFQYETII